MSARNGQAKLPPGATLRADGAVIMASDPRVLAWSEAQLQAEIAKQLEARGWCSYHTHDSRRSEPGWPDYAMTKAGWLLIVELKREAGKLTPEQETWGRLLRLVEADNPKVKYRVVRPSGYGRFVEELEEIDQQIARRAA